MNFITKEELLQKDLVSKFSVVDGNLIIEEGSEFKSNFETGDIVTYKSDSKKIGVVSFIDEDELTINWNNSSETTETISDLLIVPPTIGLCLIKNSNLVELWEELSNGKSESFDLKCIYLKDQVINEVPFIKAFKNTNTLVDKKFKRGFTLYRKFGNNQIFRTNLYTICNDKIKLDNSRFVYYLLEDHVVYYLGIDLDTNDLGVYLFNR
ncbi:MULTISPECIES: hypothetical protein [unclassified Romboutsia]|uniref:hypothetical protein n=1 Tax=unclassified Romboutsia TaxID=2626894 RepID=UPI00082102DD|nr:MULTISPECIES: hypothetical protein [unclassified Romboutsia]SCI43599.1 Uncharacterised protein [uncultured Clostridium sp.]